MTSGTVISREDISPELLFDMLANTIVRIERLEETACVAYGLLLHEAGMIREPIEQGTVQDAYAQLADYMLQVVQGRERAAADMSFLNSRE